MKQKIIIWTTITICSLLGVILILKFINSTTKFEPIYSILLFIAVMLLGFTNLFGDQTDDNFNIIYGYLLPPLLIFVGLLILGVIMLTHKHIKIGIILLTVIAVGLVVFFCVPLPSYWFFKDYNSELDPKDLIINGTWTNVYRHPMDPNKVIKQISAPGVSHNDFSHVHIPTTNKYCSRKSCTIPLMISHRLSTAVMWKSLKRVKSLNSKFFPKIYEMDDEKRRYVSEKVPHELTKDTCPDNFEEQLQELNSLLKEHGYYLDDVHSKNWMIDDKGQLKIVDCEVFTEDELKFQQNLLGQIDDSQDGAAKRHKNASRVLHWQDGRPNIEDICKN